MSPEITLASLNRRLGVLADLTARYPELPAPTVDLGQIFTDQIRLAFHDHSTALAEWTSALGIDLDSVTGSSDGFSVAWLTVTVEVDGITLELISYTRLTQAQTGGEQ